MRRPRIGFLLPHYGSHSRSYMPSVVRALADAGAEVDIIHPLEGAVIVNPYPATAALRDRVIKSRVLQLAGVPTPTAYVASTPSQLAPLLEEGPLVIKPYQEGGQVKIVRTPAELAQVELGRDPVFAQRYHPPQGRDCKIYVIGEQIFGVKKVFPRRTQEEKLGEPFTLTQELSDIARRCGRAFEIDLYGVDVIESDGKAYVVDM